MANTTIDSVSGYIYRDRLLAPEFMINDEENDPNSNLEISIRGDHNLDAYINILSKETFTQRPEGSCM